jgi:hypothetical protein
VFAGLVLLAYWQSFATFCADVFWSWPVQASEPGHVPLQVVGEQIPPSVSSWQMTPQ